MYIELCIKNKKIALLFEIMDFFVEIAILGVCGAAGVSIGWFWLLWGAVAAKAGKKLSV
ncbi:hypothetical protein [Desulfopila sp. IMCC35006]|uniref:hypothetical protein n=1 Tax=Desulfopila sp. IMCC35006 TaxID=2569542 RepID=UPI0012946B55|nr:hypothetical protein [Desulfopila sp. IMCC35006]